MLRLPLANIMFPCSCMPAGAVCCGVSGYCDAGETCLANNKCGTGSGGGGGGSGGCGVGKVECGDG